MIAGELTETKQEDANVKVMQKQSRQKSGAEFTI